MPMAATACDHPAARLKLPRRSGAPDAVPKTSAPGSGPTKADRCSRRSPMIARGTPTTRRAASDGHPVLGVIDAPFLGQSYHAIEGYGAYSGVSRLAASSTAQLRDAVVAVGDYATGPRADHKNEQRLALTIQLAPRVHRVRMLGTAALDLAWVAEGRLDASITLGNKPWDTAAGVLLAREAGATVVDTDGSAHGFHSAATIAAADPLISQLLPLIQATDANTFDSQRGF